MQPTNDSLDQQKPTTSPRGPVSIEPSVARKLAASLRVPHGVNALAIYMVIGVIGGAGLFILRASQTGTHTTIQSSTVTKDGTSQHGSTAVPGTPADSSPEQTTPAPTSVQSSKPSPTTQSPPTTQPSPAATPTPTANCLPANPSQYDLYYIKMTNSQYLRTNGYADTNKLYDGLKFAGLLGTIDTKQYSVLAVSDGTWGKLSPQQIAWMNASSQNMRSVLGWQVITSCITYKGVNATKDLPIGTTKVVNTLNGSITFTADSMGKFETAPVYIWDWYTSNGVVTFSDFVKPPQVQ